MSWKKININRQNIAGETSFSILVAMPHTCDYDSYKFWHPKTLVDNGPTSSSCTLSYWEDQTVQLIKHGKGRYNKTTIIDRLWITRQEWAEALAIMHDNIVGGLSGQEKLNAILHSSREVLNDLKD